MLVFIPPAHGSSTDSMSRLLCFLARQYGSYIRARERPNPTGSATVPLGPAWIRSRRIVHSDGSTPQPTATFSAFRVVSYRSISKEPNPRILRNRFRGGTEAGRYL